MTSSVRHSRCLVCGRPVGAGFCHGCRCEVVVSAPDLKPWDKWEPKRRPSVKQKARADECRRLLRQYACRGEFESRQVMLATFRNATLVPR